MSEEILSELGSYVGAYILFKMFIARKKISINSFKYRLSLFVYSIVVMTVVAIINGCF